MRLPCIPATDLSVAFFLFMHRWGDDTPDPGAKEYCTSQVLHLWPALLLAEKCLLLACYQRAYIPKYKLAGH
jgi:hypothetical protein